jgi:hypothetical protein
MSATRIAYSWKYVKIDKDKWLIYALMVLITIAAIFSVLYVNNILMKYLFLVGLLVLFVFINFGL